MKRFLKILAWVLAALALLVLAAVIILPRVFDPNEYRDEIAALVKKTTGRELVIEGDMDLSVFPWLGVELGKARLGNAPGFGDDPFAQVQAAKVRVKLLPLLRREVQLDTVTLEGLRLHLARNSKGETNWDDLLKRAEAEAAPEEPADKRDQKGLEALAIGGVNLQDAQITWDDRTTGQYAEVKNLVLETGELDLSSPFALRLEADLASRVPEASGHITLRTEVQADTQAERYALEDLALDLRLASRSVPSGPLRVQLAADARADLKAQTVELNKLNLDAFGLEVKGEAKGNEILDKPSGSAALSGKVRDAAQLAAALRPLLGTEVSAKAVEDGRLAIELSLTKGNARVPKFEVVALGTTLNLTADASGIPASTVAKGKITVQVKDAGALAGLLPKDFKPANLPASLKDAQLQSSFNLNLPDERLSLPDLHLTALGMDVRSDLQATGLRGEKPQVAGKLTVDQFVPRAVTEKLGIGLPEMADPNTLTKAALSTGVEASKDHIAVSDLNLRFDETTAKGRFSLRGFDKPMIRYDINVDQLDADRYLPPPAEEGVAPPASAAATAPMQLPMDFLRGLDVDGTVRVGKLKAANIRTTEVNATLQGAKGQLRLNPVGARLYSGTYAGNLGLDVRKDVPVVSMDENLNGVQVGPLLKDFMGKDYVTGRAQLAAKLTARGTEPEAIRNSLNGNASFSFQEGAVKGINVAQLLRDALAKVQGRPAPQDETRSTDFSELKGTLTVKDGLVTNQDLAAKSPLLRVSGKGTADLVTQKIDYRLDTSVVGSLEGQGGRELKELSGLTVPVHIGGTFSKPKFDVPLGKLLQERASQAFEAEKKKKQQELDKRIEEEQKRLEKDLGKELEKRGLGDLLKRR